MIKMKMPFVGAMTRERLDRDVAATFFFLFFLLTVRNSWERNIGKVTRQERTDRNRARFFVFDCLLERRIVNVKKTHTSKMVKNKSFG